AWQDYRNRYDTASDLYAQRVLGNGEIAPGWPADGVPISRSGFFELLPFATVADGLGGMLVAYPIDESGGDRVYTQRLTSAGTVAAGWYSNGIGLCTTASTRPGAASDGSTGLMGVSGDQRGPDG